MLKKKKNDYTQRFNLIVDEYALDDKKKKIVVKGKIDLQEQMNASRNDAFDKIIDRFLNKESNELPSACPPVEGQFGEFSSVDNSTYLLELEDYLSTYDGELYDADLPLSEKKSIFDAKSNEWLNDYANKLKEEKKAEILPKNENNTQEEVDNNA